VIRKKVSRLAWRIRAQSAVRWTLLAAAVGGAIGLLALALYKAWLLPPTWWLGIGYGVAGVVALGFLAGIARRFDRVLLAQRIDDANDLKDRLGTALRLLAKAERTEFEQAQVRDASKFAAAADHRPAAPWHFPRELAWVALAIVAVWGLTRVEMEPPNDRHHGLRPVFFAGSLNLVPTRLAGPPMPEVTPEDLDMIAEIEAAIADNTETLGPLAKDDKEATKLVSELNKTLEQLAEGELDDRQVMERAAELGEQLDSMEGDEAQQQQYDETAENFEKLGEALEKAAPKAKLKDKELEKDIKELGKMLQKRDYEQASKLMEKMLEKFMKLPPREQERLAKMFEKLARKFKSKLGKDMKNLPNKRDRLQRKGENKKNGPSKRDRDRLNRLNKQLDQLQRKYEEKTSQQNKQLDQLSREMQKMANEMRRQKPQKQKGQQKGQKEDKQQAQQQKRRASKQSMKRMQEMMKRMGKQKQRQRLKRMGKMRLADLKELMKRKRNMKKGKGGKSGKQLSKLSRKRGKQGGQKQKGQGQGQMKPGDQKRGVEWMKGKQPRDIEAKMGQAREGKGAGHGRDRMLQGKATDIEGTAKEDFVAGKHGKGPSVKEVLYGAARTGTNVKGYGDVHVDYSMRAAEQMEDEKLPPGYREYVEEYFRLIQRRR
jgi:hypothetical protein